jgi:ribosomal protein S18 acetylase RimI-like enzyme
MPERTNPADTSIDVVPADLENPRHRAALLEVLSSYAEDPMGGGRPLETGVRETVLDELAKVPSREVLLAFAEDHAVGIAVCFLGFSTFRASPVLNLHDLAVVPDARARGVGRRLLEAVEARARELRCCKLTLEVQEQNERARGLYASFGFGDFAPGDQQTRTLFLEKLLPDR